MDPANSDEDNHDSNDSTSLPTNDIKVEKSTGNSEKAIRLRAKPDIPVMFSDSEDSFDGYYSKKRKNDSESEDDWAPKKGKAASPKKKVKTEKPPKKSRKQRESKSKTPKEPKAKKEKGTPKARKPRGKKAKEVKEENSNDASDVNDEPELPPEKETEEEADGEGDVDRDNDTAEESNPASAEYSVSSS
uniref:Uncharacterized protein n=1 Tax=Graphocephala atropunctata TaxID=36148 RepID=A0A1B6M675_9HEMI